jgi:hypothetical protein
VRSAKVWWSVCVCGGGYHLACALYTKDMHFFLQKESQNIFKFYFAISS